jgi:serine-type D-Ala-D-Ala carboxypeptidase (penicillin-binding protein 5/6)
LLLQLRLIVVVMECALKGSQTSDAITLLDYGFEHYASAGLLPRNQVCVRVKVKTGTAKEVAAVLPDGLNAIYLKREGIHFTRRQELVESVTESVIRGHKLGEMQILANGKLLKKVDLTAAADVGRLSLPRLTSPNSNDKQTTYTERWLSAFSLGSSPIPR